MNYEVGKQYEMNVVDIRKDSAGHNYIALYDDDPNKEYRVYNILKCQLDSLPDTIYVIVKSIDVFGKIKFAQDIARLNKEHYHEGKLYAFDVIVEAEYEIPANTGVFMRKYQEKYSSKSPRIFLFVCNDGKVASFYDEVKVVSANKNSITIKSLLRI